MKAIKIFLFLTILLSNFTAFTKNEMPYVIDSTLIEKIDTLLFQKNFWINFSYITNKYGDRYTLSPEFCFIKIKSTSESKNCNMQIPEYGEDDWHIINCPYDDFKFEKHCKKKTIYYEAYFSIVINDKIVDVYLFINCDAQVYAIFRGENFFSEITYHGKLYSPEAIETRKKTNYNK